MISLKDVLHILLEEKIQSHFPIQAWPDEGSVMPGRRLMTKSCDKVGEQVII
jgi:hypothetical protein